jgi:hypothetical protein
MLKKIHLKCQNGISFNTAIKEIFFDLTDTFEFIESKEPDFILFGPYGNDLPPKGPYTRIGYYCENILPDMSLCEWAFGIPLEKDIQHSKYKRIQWHGLNPASLLRSLSDNEIDRVLNEKQKFCNFLYSNPVSYRELFFKQLSKYKKIDAPGRSMNNMNSIDSLYKGDIWNRKRQFLSPYKFTIALENYAYPGYQTEKLYDAMQTNSLPIYCGDDNISEIFNPKSFLNTPDYVPNKKTGLIQFLERSSQQNFVDIRPQFYKTPVHRITRKLKSMGRKLKMNLQFNQLNFSALIERIIEIDTKPELYIQYLKEPWFYENKIPLETTNKTRWIEIFNSKL